MKLILERNLDFKQFQNLIILTFTSVIILLGMLYSLKFRDFIFTEIILFFLSVLFVAILFTKKGLYLQNERLYTGVFLFGYVVYKKQIFTHDYQKLILVKGKLSTNYNYTTDFTKFRYWEPNLNHSLNSFSIIMLNEKDNQRKKILILTVPEKIENAMDFIIKNTNLSYHNGR